MKCLYVLPLMLAIVAYGADAAKSADPSAPHGKSYVYKQSGGEAQELEVYFPKNWDAKTSKVPGVLLFHGGGWSGGTLDQFRHACHYLASRGLVAATANYRMLHKDAIAKLPAGQSRKRVCITDAKSAIRWFKQHAAELGIDPNRVITGGGSAGGHIAVLATQNAGLNDPADPPGIDTSVVAYLLFNPALSPDDRIDAEVDALHYLKPTFAPSIAFFGTTDKYKNGWDAARNRLKGLGNQSSQLWLAEGQKHSFFNKDPWRTLTLIAADRFLVQHGLLQGEPTLAPPATGESLVAAPDGASQATK